MALFDVTKYGATGKGAPSDDRRGIQAALTACGRAGGGTVYFPAGTYFWTGTIEVPANVRVTGDGNASVLLPEIPRGEAIVVAGRQASIEQLRIGGASLVAISVRNGASGFTARALHFDGARGMSHCVLLHTCDDILVQDCAFTSAGYGIIQQKGHSSNHVRVTGCTVRDSRGDFVECNSATVDSSDWIIDHNRFLGSAQTGTEERFVGITRVANVLIANNHVYGVGGDAAVHLEGDLGNVRVVHNHFENCRVTGGNLGYVYITDSGKSVLVQGNTFVQSDPKLPLAFALDTANSAIAPRIVFADNRVVATAGALFGGLSLAFNQGSSDVRGNEFQGLQVGVRANSAAQVRVSENDFLRCLRGVHCSPDAPTGGGGTGFIIRGNRFSGTGLSCIETDRNGSGTGAPEKWVISDNWFDSTVRVRDGLDIVARDNVLMPGASLDVHAVGHGGGARNAERSTHVLGSGPKPNT
jgi:hypothetical protein